MLLLVLALAAPAAAGSQRNFRAHLAGRNEVPPVDTNATGQAIFQLSKDGSELSYKLIVANIENVAAAHIHCGVVGVAGPVGVTLSGAAPAGRFDGILAQGTITTPNPGNSCGWTDLGEVLDAILSANAYVNVHTTANPGGEIRGQIH
jgi:hypothetical protein